MFVVVREDMVKGCIFPSLGLHSTHLGRSLPVTSLASEDIESDVASRISCGVSSLHVAGGLEPRQLICSRVRVGRGGIAQDGREVAGGIK